MTYAKSETKTACVWFEVAHCLYAMDDRTSIAVINSWFKFKSNSVE